MRIGLVAGMRPERARVVADQLTAGAPIGVPVVSLLRLPKALPPQVLIRNGLSKAALRVAMRDDLPGYIVERPKMTFARGSATGTADRLKDMGCSPTVTAGLLRSRRGGGRDVYPLSIGPVEHYTLARFTEHGYDRAAYMLSRTLWEMRKGQANEHE